MDKNTYVETFDDRRDVAEPIIKTYGSVAAFAFTINYIIGVGVLAVPYGFWQAGWLLSVIILFIVTIVSYITMVWLVEVIARMEGLRALLGEEHEALIANVNPATYGSITSTDRMSISFRKYEINELCAYFLGPVWQRLYEVAVFAYLFGCLWGFASIFGTTAADVIPVLGLSNDVWPCGFYGSSLSTECFYSYQVFVAIFALVVVPVSLMDLSDQTLIQIILCAYRFVAFFIMVISVGVVMSMRPYESYSTRTESPYIADGFDRLIDFSGFGIIFSTSVFAQLTHHSIPGIIQPVQDKTKLREIFFSSLIVTFFFYTIMGIVLAMYFGDGVKDLVTLNFQAPSGSSPGVGEYFIRYPVILLPVFLSLSAFPITGVTLGNNLFAALPAKWTQNQTSKRVRLLCRLAAVIPPLILGTFIYELSIVVQFTGLFGVFLAFLFPAMLQYYSIKRVKDEFAEDIATPYTTFYSTMPFIVAVFLFGLVALALMLTVTISPSVFG